MTINAARARARGAMGVFVRARTMIAGVERDVLVEVHRLDALQSGEAPCALLDDFTVWAAPAPTPLERLEPDDDDELMGAVEGVIEGICR